MNLDQVNITLKKKTVTQNNFQGENVKFGNCCSNFYKKNNNEKLNKFKFIWEFKPETESLINFFSKSIIYFKLKKLT